MKNNYDAISDKEFLFQLDQQQMRETYARITALNLKEEPLEEIESKVSGGSINVDGTSALRRSCNLTLLAENININEYLWNIKCKFKLEIGLKNFINSEYPDIIWFKQGIYVINSFNISSNANSYTISISGKDKMCLLNGNLGGSLNASIDFGTEEYYDSETNITTYTQVPIKKILKESLRTYAGEQYYNIIINDLDEAAVELLEYKGDKPAFLIYDIAQSSYMNLTMNERMACKVVGDDGQERQCDLGTIETTGQGHYDPRVNIDDAGGEGSDVYLALKNGGFNSSPCKIAKLEYGQTAGYRITELTYAGSLISKVGETLTSIYDKIVKMLGNYEYFYDIDGRFIFQRKRVYLNQNWNGYRKTSDQNFIDPLVYTSASTYNFTNNETIISLSNAPVLNNIKNDYSIWGTRESISGTELKVHYRYAIDTKPERYKAFDGTVYVTSGNEENAVKRDWRELIYQMALDYYKHNEEEDFLIELEKNNPEYLNGITGYENYYIDLQGFWRQLYNPDPEEDGKDDYDEYFWNRAINENPTSLNFWFDFLDNDVELSKYSISNIGVRAKVIEDKNIKAIYFREVPNLIFVNPLNSAAAETGYVTVRVSDQLDNLFKISAQGKSAKDTLEELLYQYSYLAENITINSLPIYYLEPNTRIFVQDEKTKINGDYIMTKFTIPLTYNGTMNINASKAPERLTVGAYTR